MVIYVPGTEETDPKKQNMALQQLGGATATNTTAIATLNAATYVNSIAGRTGVITLNTASGITNSSNDVVLSQASSSQFGTVKVDGTTITSSSGVISAALVSASQLTNSSTADIALNNTGTFFAGPTIANSTNGTWFASGSVTLTDTAGVAAFDVRLWDGTTVFASGIGRTTGASLPVSVALSGLITSPSSSIRISVKDISATTGKILFNTSGDSKDSTVSAYRIA